MAKQQKKRQARPSWFKKQVEKNGKDFLLRKQPQEIQREALNIIRDICRGNITKNDYEYLFDLKILSNVRLGILERYNEVSVYNACMTFTINTPNSLQVLETSFGVTPEMFQHFANNNMKLLQAYQCALYNIDNLIMFVQSPNIKTEEDFEQIATTVGYQLYNFRYII